MAMATALAMTMARARASARAMAVARARGRVDGVGARVWGIAKTRTKVAMELRTSYEFLFSVGCFI